MSDALLVLALVALLAVSASARRARLRARARERHLLAVLHRSIPSLRYAVRAASTRSIINPQTRADLAAHQSALTITIATCNDTVLPPPPSAAPSSPPLPSEPWSSPP